MNKINVAELLKDCPKGMELDCAIFENVTFEEVITVRGFDDKKRVKIILSTHYSDGTKDEISLTEFGTYTDDETAKCVIFPKGKTTWEGFHRPFKDGDIVITKTSNNFIFYSIYKGIENREVLTYIDYKPDFNRLINAYAALCYTYEIIEQRLATEAEKQKLFDAIKANGYKWNAETKTLEKLIEPKFKVEKGKWYVCIKDLLDNYANKAFCKGDTYYSPEDGYLIPSNSNVPYKVEYCTDEYFRAHKTKTLGKLVEPIFEVGNKIEKCGYRFTIAEVKDEYYLTKCGNKIPIDSQDDFSLVPNKFDITTLKPFDKVLVRNTNSELWRISLFGCFSNEERYFMCMANSAFYQCIPYNEDTKHLVGTADDCDEYYKTWE